MFIANILPASVVQGIPADQLAPLADFVTAKHDGMWALGDLSGDYPSCTVVPEPAAMALLGLGLGTMLVTKKGRKRRP
jgi:hypothetical protein